jgi:hypothetical protein
MVFICIFYSVSLCAVADGASCKQQGVIVKNLHIDALWYKKSNGNCIKWKRNYMFTVKPNDVVEIFSDMCITPFCSSTPAYSDYKSNDTNSNCRVRILRRCNLSDM